MTKKVLVPIADGSEDIETSCITDILVRGGIGVIVASVMPEGQKTVKMARGLNITADVHISEVKNSHFDAIALPGGMPGAKHLAACGELTEMLKAQKHQGKLFGAICASPAVALGPNGLLDGVSKVTCYPSVKDKLPHGVHFSPTEQVVYSNHCLTSQGPGTAMIFALSLVSLLTSPEKAADVGQGLLLNVTPEDFSGMAKL